MVLGAVGIYGIVSYSVTQRTHEIGIRMALGARAGNVLSLIMKNGLTLVLTGIVIGIAGALALTRFLTTLLFGVTPTDSVTFVVVSVDVFCDRDGRVVDSGVEGDARGSARSRCDTNELDRIYRIYRIDMMNSIIKDVRFALRGLLKHPAFTAIAVVTLALGIGGSTSIFTVVDAALLRGLPYKSPDRLYHLWEQTPKTGIPEA